MSTGSRLNEASPTGAPTADATDADELEAFAVARLTPDAFVEVHRGADEIRTRAALKACLLPELEAAFAPR